MAEPDLRKALKGRYNEAVEKLPSMSVDVPPLVSPTTPPPTADELAVAWRRGLQLLGAILVLTLIVVLIVVVSGG